MTKINVFVEPSDNPAVCLPEFATSGAAAGDLRAIEMVTILPGQRVLVNTGLKMAIPQGFEAQIRSRSGMALKRGLVVANAPGTIDSDYRGEVGVILHNISDQPQTVGVGERIAQMAFAKVYEPEFIHVGDLSELATARGAGGFGSTGTT